MLTAIVLIDCAQADITSTGTAVANADGVSEVYSMTGVADLIAILRLPETESVADIVTARITTIPGVRTTRTQLAARAYSTYDVEGAFSIGIPGPAST